MVDARLLEILACPWCLGGLDHQGEKLTCRRCRAAYSIVDDIPNMVVEEAELHCPRCADRLTVGDRKAFCPHCGREWSTDERPPEFSGPGPSF